MQLLIVGALEGYITTAGQIAMARGAKVSHVEDGEAALVALRSGQGADLLMVDVTNDIAKLISALKSERIAVPVIACGIGNDTKSAVAAIKAGAKEYIPLPPNADLIAAILEAVTAETQGFVYADPIMAQTLKLAEQIAPSDASVLILGESGCGKEVMAQFLHRKSRRSRAKLVSVNCAAIPENLLESELFGHEKGAFTGAVARRIGKFEEANGGTLLLDEISEMDVRLQAKLLRALQEREIDRVGGTQPVKIDIRILATSNRELGAEVRSGRFREDLYYRLNVVSLIMPPLRDRRADIQPIAEHFIEKYSQINGFDPRPLTSEALKKLQAYDWPGNVRELENTIHRAVLIAPPDSISAESIVLTGLFNGLGKNRETEAANNDSATATPFPTLTAGDGASGSGGKTVADVERKLIIDTLETCLGNRTRAATILGISIRTLRNKLKQYNDDGLYTAPPESGMGAA